MVFGPYLKYIFPLSIQMRKNEGRHKKSLYHDGDTREERGERTPIFGFELLRHGPGL